MKVIQNAKLTLVLLISRCNQVFTGGRFSPNSKQLGDQFGICDGLNLAFSGGDRPFVDVFSMNKTGFPI